MATLTVLVVAALATDTAAATPVAAVIVTATFGARAAAGLLVVATGQPVAAVPAQPAGGTEDFAPVARYAAAAF